MSTWQIAEGEEDAGSAPGLFLWSLFSAFVFVIQ